MLRRGSFFFLVISLVFGCQQQQDDARQASSITGGRCLLQKDSSSYLCLDFSAGSDTNTDDSTCTSVYSQYLGSYGGVRGKDFLSGDANTCANATNDTAVGKCSRSDGTLYYYNAAWSAGSSQTDCSSVQSGTWSTP